MKHLQSIAIAMICASVAAAQGTKAPVTKAPAKPDSSKAPATKTADTKQGTKAPETKAAALGTKVADTKQAPAAGTKAPAGAPAATPAAALNAAQQAQLKTPVIMREVFDYGIDGRRDPFVSLLSSSDLRPTVADLRLTGVLYDENGPNSIAVMRDLVTNAQYRVVTGQTLGRMKVALIKRKVVIFSIEEFGQNRQDSLVLGDTTKARAK